MCHIYSALSFFVIRDLSCQRPNRMSGTFVQTSTSIGSCRHVIMHCASTLVTYVDLRKYKTQLKRNSNFCPPIFQRSLNSPSDSQVISSPHLYYPIAYSTLRMQYFFSVIALFSILLLRVDACCNQSDSYPLGLGDYRWIAWSKPDCSGIQTDIIGTSSRQGPCNSPAMCTTLKKPQKVASHVLTSDMRVWLELFEGDNCQGKKIGGSSSEGTTGMVIDNVKHTFVSSINVCAH
ncbi:hypothetical protein BJ138DRAFT_1155122 [Hygrophoropsis aurantiaca]|uniref:Uncharacterized protein n=1 Tax=Hygrophoropsis aurantiaca TaxID=72124 RepID=A0ACB8A7M8_9AGAM|nr:hypothetical protein BJ138DRAFT_1155122 [Hygrophoropsis aurantiaca]